MMCWGEGRGKKKARNNNCYSTQTAKWYDILQISYYLSQTQKLQNLSSLWVYGIDTESFKILKN